MQKTIILLLLYCGSTYILGQTQQQSICPCDSTGNSCDINCCCDKECDENDKKVFSQCLDYSQSYDPKLCIQRNLVVFNNTDYLTEYKQNNLLCIYYDNYAARNFYTEPTVVDNLEKFRDYDNLYGSRNNFSRTDYLRFENGGENLNTYYKVGDKILTVNGESQLSYFIVPRSGMTSFCTYNSPAEFLVNKKYNCIESIKDLSQKCTSAWHLNAENFYANFALLKNLKNAQNPNVPAIQQNGTRPVDNKVVFDVVDIQPIIDSNELNNTSGIGLMPKPLWLATSNVCQSVPFKVEYEVTISKEGDISSAIAKLYLRNVDSAEQYFKREFSISYKMLSNKENASNEDTIVRSGNPGYSFSLPVMAGEGVFNDTREAVLLSLDNTQWLTTVKSDSTGVCKSDSRQPVLFGINHETGCIVELQSNATLNQCKQIRQDILNALRGPLRNRIGSFGNASIYNAKEWVPILEENSPHGEAGNPNAGVCSNIVLGSDTEILYAYSGYALKPQARIIGAKTVFRAPGEIRFQCPSGISCGSGDKKSTKHFVSSTVTFVDVSQSPTPAVAEIPTFDIKLPNDFFYPFSCCVKPSISYSLLATFVTIFSIL